MPGVKLSVKYETEPEALCNELIDIVGTEFILCELDSDTEKQQRVLQLKPDVAKYFAVGTLSSFKPNMHVKRYYLNIYKFVVKQQGYIVEHKEHIIKYETGLYKKTSKYKIFRDCQ
jgi:hypothetical protein